MSAMVLGKPESQGDGGVVCLQGGNGDTYFVSRYAEPGTLGKFRLAIDGSGREVGIKEYGARGAGKAERESKVELARTETQILEALGSPLQPREFLKVDGRLYAVVPLMEGDIFDAVCRLPNGTPKTQVVRSVVRQAMSHLCHCHAMGILHRDIKLDNLLWDRHGHVFLSDYDLSISVGRGGNAVGIWGSRGAFAPEMLTELGHGAPSDIWGLGIALIYAYADQQLSPFWLAGKVIRGHIPVAAMHEAFAEFRDWRAARCRDDGSHLISMSRVQEGTTRLDQLFQQLHDGDPILCQLVLNTMLRMHPLDRATAAQIEPFAQALQPAESADETTARLYFQQRANANRRRRRTLQRLRVHFNHRWWAKPVE